MNIKCGWFSWDEDTDLFERCESDAVCLSCNYGDVCHKHRCRCSTKTRNFSLNLQEFSEKNIIKAEIQTADGSWVEISNTINIRIKERLNNE